MTWNSVEMMIQWKSVAIFFASGRFDDLMQRPDTHPHHEPVSSTCQRPAEIFGQMISTPSHRFEAKQSFWGLFWPITSRGEHVLLQRTDAAHSDLRIQFVDFDLIIRDLIRQRGHLPIEHISLLNLLFRSIPARELKLCVVVWNLSGNRCRWHYFKA
jgi:hypothetical protein